METNQLLINYYKKEEVKKAKQRRQEGCTLKEIIRLANKEYISIEEIKQALGIDEDEIEEHQEVEQEEHKVDEYDEIYKVSFLLKINDFWISILTTYSKI